MNPYLIDHIDDFMHRNLKIPINHKTEQHILGTLLLRPELRITVGELLFSDLKSLSDRFIMLLMAITEQQGGAGPTPRDTIIRTLYPGGYAQEKAHDRIQYRLIKAEDIPTCKNTFEQCDDPSSHPEYCIVYDQVAPESRTRDCLPGQMCSPVDLITKDTLSNSETGMIYQHTATGQCYDGQYLSEWLSQHDNNPLTREYYDRMDKVRVYVDTMIKQELGDRKLKNRFTRLTRYIHDHPFFSLGATITGTMLLNTVHDQLVYGVPLARVSFSETTTSDHIQGIIGVSAIMGVSYYAFYHKEQHILHDVIPKEIYNRVHEELYRQVFIRQRTYFDDLPDLPEGNVLETMKKYI